MAVPIEHSQTDLPEIPNPKIQHVVEEDEASSQKKRKLTGDIEEKSDVKTPNLSLPESESITWGSLATLQEKVRDLVSN